ncbi:glutamine synthetase [Ponticoccus sp. SC2-23]|uniref:glutamine synthetase family protein n=1 Tax=Alexandriicola marinus TaxID=2081710 RepID=UPI000FD76486|nr:glutamine synthetase family protein [Alexandriicola marinus]MBM1220934.1 glutamine synthetase [Ponticoccus sp. SC6-9]MBM1225504.1 glutamine synthetase [Ponticoccus sp. SC6-15]MBM1227687.1 glutamine synthetase [Ponticoccus sp. SC6-38]MBM1234675.1 glutamine synthetase [Ponticoccus sp. SC6-45]MBM1238189.1 glutamine synthetase [Ponticoccus sp. SC6-49]MBM1244178.1 glutamine synthetase [Ponticoccus sp. SC2-64]MBM1248199.1 glutamine synthetase [Ponticoccus sp. SC6-42]MBM1252589.1 glutamine synt
MPDRLRTLFIDHLSIPRGKHLPASKIGDGSSRFARATFGVHYDRDLMLDAPHAMVRQGMPDMELRWQGAEIRDSWDPGTKVVLGDLYDVDGAPLPLCPRGTLKRAVADWAKLGLTPKLGIELEAYAMQGDESGQLRPYDAPGGVVYGTGPFADPMRINDLIWQKADEMGFRLEMITAEYDSPQYEYTLTFDDALKAVDDIVLFRLMAREIALDHGVILTFLPKPIPELGGSGMHINFSFTDAEGNNAVASGPRGGPDHLSDLARGCLAGLVHHHKGLAALVSPTAGSYLRLQPAAMSGYWRNWGGDHRAVTTRVSSEGGAKARLEHRMADASANPYTACAAVLQAARLGFENGYALPPMETGDGFDRTDAREGVAPNLRRAVQDMVADGALTAAVGSELCAHQAYMKEQEFRKTRDLEPNALLDFYVWFV